MHEPLYIESLDHEGRGVGRRDGKTLFVDGALTGETVEYASYRRKPGFEQAQATRILSASPYRVKPACRWFGICGGCSHQHLDEAAQVAAKQRVLEDCFSHIGKVTPETILPPIHGQTWGYRTRARLSVRNVPKKGGVLVGFHERRSSYVADMGGCEVLPAGFPLCCPNCGSWWRACPFAIACPRSSWPPARRWTCWCCGCWSRPRRRTRRA
ncbi:MAG: hypothetical protein KBG41_05055 [Thiobacillaceae bacterium]|nr:hypothetical protein [Thiobacillaceae bacterium]